MPNNDREKFVISKFVPASIYAREDDVIHTRLCVYNYYSELFPEKKSGADVHIWFFDQEGEQVGKREFKIGYQGQLQYDLSELGTQFEGIACLSIVPEDPPRFRHSGVSSGFYSFYSDDHGHSDFSHEWETLRFSAKETSPWICVVRPFQFPETDIIVMNSCFANNENESYAPWAIKIRNSQGENISEKEMPALKPRGSARINVLEVFPEIDTGKFKSETLSVEVTGINIQGPFTYVKAPNGDFNLHHFC